MLRATPPDLMPEQSEDVRWRCPECGDVWVDDDPGNAEIPRCCNDDDPEHSSGVDRMGVRMERDLRRAVAA